MEFKNAAQAETYERVKGWMQELFGEMAKVYTDTPTFSVWMGSALTYVNVYAWGDDRATVQCFAWVVTGAEMSADLMQFLRKAASARWTRDFTVETGAWRTRAISSNVISSSNLRLTASR